MNNNAYYIKSNRPYTAPSSRVASILSNTGDYKKFIMDNLMPKLNQSGSIGTTTKSSPNSATRTTRPAVLYSSAPYPRAITEMPSGQKTGSVTFNDPDFKNSILKRFEKDPKIRKAEAPLVLKKDESVRRTKSPQQPSYASSCSSNETLLEEASGRRFSPTSSSLSSKSKSLSSTSSSSHSSIGSSPRSYSPIYDTESQMEIMKRDFEVLKETDSFQFFPGNNATSEVEKPRKEESKPAEVVVQAKSAAKEQEERKPAEVVQAKSVSKESEKSKPAEFVQTKSAAKEPEEVKRAPAARLDVDESSSIKRSSADSDVKSRIRLFQEKINSERSSVFSKTSLISAKKLPPKPLANFRRESDASSRTTDVQSSSSITSAFLNKINENGPSSRVNTATVVRASVEETSPFVSGSTSRVKNLKSAFESKAARK